MGANIDRQSVIRLASAYRLQWEEAQQAYVLLYPEGMVTLNATASEILRRCDGERTVADIIQELRTHFPGAELESDTLEFMEVAHDEGWIRAQ